MSEFQKIIKDFGRGLITEQECKERLFLLLYEEMENKYLAEIAVG